MLLRSSTRRSYPVQYSRERKARAAPLQASAADRTSTRAVVGSLALREATDSAREKIIQKRLWGRFSFGRDCRFGARENNENACGGDLALGEATDSVRERK